MKKVIIIGGGVSGLMAIHSISSNHQILLLEKNDTLGKKLLLTGHGRCNITNLKPISEFLKHCNRESSFLYSSLSQFSSEDIFGFFQNRNCPLKIEDNNRVFPVSDNAQDILNVLTNFERPVQIQTNCAVQDWILENNRIVGVQTSNGNYYADHFILAVGGMSYPATGSSGDGYALLKKLGHAITPLSGAEVPLVCQDEVISSKALMGVSLKDVTVVSGKKKVQGDVLFTHFGLSGPAILEISEFVKDEIKLVFKKIDCPYVNAVEMGVAKRYFEWVQNTCPIKGDFNHMTSWQRRQYLDHFECQTFKISGPLGIKQATVTKGGVSTDEVNPKNMRSKLVDNLSICGEILNCHGSVGGYNLTIALSSGYTAGRHI